MQFLSWDFNKSNSYNLLANENAVLDRSRKLHRNWEWTKDIDGINVYDVSPELKSIYQDCNSIQSLYHIAKYAEYVAYKIENELGNNTIISACTDYILSIGSGVLIGYAVKSSSSNRLLVSFSGPSIDFSGGGYPQDILSGSIISASNLKSLLDNYGIENSISEDNYYTGESYCGGDWYFGNCRDFFAQDMGFADWDSVPNGELTTIQSGSAQSKKDAYIDFFNSVKDEYLGYANELKTRVKSREYASSQTHIDLIELGIISDWIQGEYLKGRVSDYNSVSSIKLELGMYDDSGHGRNGYKVNKTFIEQDLLDLISIDDIDLLYDSNIVVKKLYDEGLTTEHYRYYLNISAIKRVDFLELEDIPKIYEYFMTSLYIENVSENTSWLERFVSFGFTVFSLALAVSSAGATYGVSLILFADQQSGGELLNDDQRLALQFGSVYAGYSKGTMSGFNATATSANYATQYYFNKRQKELESQVDAISASIQEIIDELTEEEKKPDFKYSSIDFGYRFQPLDRLSLRLESMTDKHKYKYDLNRRKVIDGKFNN